MSHIGFVGTGHIAAPMVRHLAAKGHTIRVTTRNRATSSALAAELGVSVAEPQGVIDESDIVILCLRPHIAADVLEPLAFCEGQTIVSVMAGIPNDLLRTLCAPAQDYVQTIPLGYLETGGCPLPAYGDHRALSALFAPENPVIPVASEDALNAHFAVCAVLPGVLDLMASSANWLSDQTGDAAGAEFYTTQLIAGYLSSMDKDAAGRLAAERDSLATEGTISLQMTTALREAGAHDALLAAMDTIGERLRGNND